ncbi:uncharacterized protein LOC129765816 [Toxorhynchites rutilus septentrionalis]|uniref:uncharacterized protein LOC129765816 n=1 Tax=Toxorhynchites rutilus septentrionalis TaxID=329112 RepID=UPI00247A7B9B|nr:uncharacterized protein LOC129765816 [Toxorhynchites rutilus septentrionalis]
MASKNSGKRGAKQLTSSELSCKSTTSSAKARLAELELKRLEEEKKLNENLLNERLQKEKDIQQKENQQERERCEKELKEKERLEKEFLTKWYEVMRSMAEEDDGGSCRSFHTNRSSANKVKHWLNVQVLPTSEVVSGEIQNPTIIPSNTKPTTVLQSPVGTSRPIPEPNTTQVIPQMTSSEQQKQIQMLPMRASVVTQRFAKPLIASSTPIQQQSGQPAAQRQQFEFQHITQAHPPSHAPFQEIPHDVRPGEVRPTEHVNDRYMVPNYGHVPTATVHDYQTPVVLPSLAPVATGSQQLYGPNVQQLQARNVVPKELPWFNGDPSDWPIFISSYNNTTQMCGYSDSENLMRLQRCLQDKAREAVKSFLLHPSTLPQVLSTLYMLYGRPELIANTLLTKARSSPAPKADKLDSLIGRVEAPDVAIFSSFMTSLVSAVSHVVSPVVVVTEPNSEKRKDRGYINSHSVVGDSSTSADEQFNPKPCPICKKAGHKTKDCFEFRKLDVDTRWKLVQQNSLCRRCLTSHGKRPCKSDVCGIDGCEYRHHRLLYSVKSTCEIKQTKKSTPMGTASLHCDENGSTLFRLIPVTLHGKNVQVSTYAFLDDGSELTLVDKDLAKKLNANGELQPLCMQWTSGVTRAEPDSQILQLRISGRGKAKEFALKDVHTVSSLKLPTQTMVYSELQERFQHLQGLAIEDYQRVTPQLLIGLDNTRLCASLKIKEGKSGEPVAAKTRLGWMIYGSLPGTITFNRQRYVHVCTRSSEDELHNLVQNFFDVESAGVRATPLLESSDIYRARTILEATTHRTSTGRFETGLLWRSDYIEQQLKDYQLKGYAHIITEEELWSADPRRVWYLPVGFVENPKKPAKVRIVWDAAAKSEKVSFNSMILKGPDLLTSLPGVLSRFRQRKVAISGDIKEMFHQVLIRGADRDSQRFLWRDDPTQPVDTYVMDVAVFGSACSPCSSQFVKNLNAKEHEKTYPRAAQAIIRSHYVDDYLDSFDTINEAITVANDVKLVHGRAGFEIRNWLSNKTEVVNQIGNGSGESVRTFTLDKGNGCERVLGISWIPDEDVFRFSLVLRDELRGLLEEKIVPTKRQILRVVMSVFDPLGLITMLVIHGKIIIQEVWKSGTGWDDAISATNFVRWQRWTTALSHLKEIAIPRCYFPGYCPNSLDTMELHIFVDASEEAFACVGYFRVIDRDQVRCALVSSKSKVAPVKALSIPRLELQAAVIGTRLAKSIAENHDLPILRRVF